jgi:hypothetical protein
MSKDPKHHHPEDADVEGHHHHDHAHDETIIVTPKGGSKTRFLMTFLLVLLLLTTFSVSNEVVACFSRGDSATKGYVSWKDPAVGVRSVRTADFLTEKQTLAKFWAILSQGRDRDRSDDDTAQFLLMSDLSENAGVRVTDTDLKNFITKYFPSSETYKAILQGHKITPKEFEQTLRRVLRVERYQALLAEGFAAPDPAEVEKMWKGRHQEFAFDYIELSSSNLTDEAKGMSPATDALKAWFDALPDAEKDKYKTQPVASADLVALSLDGDVKTDLLFAAYPRPAGEDAEAAAKDFYAGFGYARFRRTNFKPEEIKKIEDLNEPFENVKEIAKRDALIYRSLAAWQADLAEREKKGEAIDLAAEAKKLGLVEHAEEKPLDQAAWGKLEGPWAGRYVTDAVFSGTAGKLLPAIVVEAKAFVFGRVLGKEDSKMPAFADIEAKVRESWVAKKAAEIAVARLEALRDKFGARPDPKDANAEAFKPEADAEKFAAVAKEAGYEVKHRDFEEHYERIAPEAMTPAETYLRNSSELYVLKEGTVDKAGQSSDSAFAYLVRVAGVRDPNPSKMSPAELQSISKQLGDQSALEFKTGTLTSIEYAKQRYGLDVESWHREKKPTN